MTKKVSPLSKALKIKKILSDLGVPLTEIDIFDASWSTPKRGASIVLVVSEGILLLEIIHGGGRAGFLGAKDNDNWFFCWTSPARRPKFNELCKQFAPTGSHSQVSKKQFQQGLTLIAQYYPRSKKQVRLLPRSATNIKLDLGAPKYPRFHLPTS